MMEDGNMRIPKHIGVIPDGNRRWASAKGLKKEDGYGYGLEPGIRLLQKAIQYGIEEITYYGFTMDNCKRPKVQLEAFRNACIEAVHLMEQENADVYVIGNTQSKCFPKELLDYTKPRKKKKGCVKVNLLVNYGWEWDLKNGLCSKDISRMDMILRWGGMCRLSGFLPVQSVYSDFYVLKELWPDFAEGQFDQAMAWYQMQDVTLGG